jgi:pimeloyl-ACP methyl ester carboxylesterase
MRSVNIPATPGTAAPHCIICLPGAYHAPEDFLSAGFHTCVGERGLPIDLLFVDPELQYLGDRRFREQLEREIVHPMRCAGGSSIWLAGISLGGFMALDYAAANPGDLDGVCLLAPYLGNRMLTADIANTQDLRTWRPDDLAQFDEEHRIWRFIQAQPAGSEFLYLGYGSEDRFAEAHRSMARALPARSLDVVPGGHDWRTWTTLWENFLDSRFG